MKKSIKVLFISILTFFLFLPLLYSGGVQDNTLSGTWYGGSTMPGHQGYKYQYTFTPTGNGRFMAIADGVYGPDSFGVALQTKWTGEVLEQADGNYEIRLISLTSNDLIDPPDELPNILAVIGRLMLHENGEIEIQYYWYGMYSWDLKPFVDTPSVWFLFKNSDPIIEFLKKMENSDNPPDIPDM